MTVIKVRKGSADIFHDLGFSNAEAEEALAKSELISAIASTIKGRKLTQTEAAVICGADQPTLSKVLRGRMESITIDKLTHWLTALGRNVEIRIGRRVNVRGGHIAVQAV